MRYFLLVLVVLLVMVPSAHASEIITRDARNIDLKVDKQGRAVVFYTKGGKRFHVLATGAINARHPSRRVRQVKFNIDYSGGIVKFKRPIWRSVRSCRPYTGPKLEWLVKACNAPDGSRWALQAWQRQLPDYGVRPTRFQRNTELRLSHWKGPIAQLTVHQNWVFRGRFTQLFGTYKYKGVPVHGFKSTKRGVPLDTYGRNLYTDTLNSAYGPGWKRENSFLAPRPLGQFCYGFFPHGNRPIGKGQQYRITVIGPGVTPDVFWTAPALHDFTGSPADIAFENQMNALLVRLKAPNSECQVT